MHGPATCAPELEQTRERRVASRLSTLPFSPRPPAPASLFPRGPTWTPPAPSKRVSATRWDGSHPNGRALGDWRAPIRATAFPRFGVKPLSHCVTPLSAARREGRGKDPYPWPRREPLAALTNRRPSRHNGPCINSKGAQVGPLAEYKSRYRAGSSYPAPANRQDFSSLCVLMHGPTPFARRNPCRNNVECCHEARDRER